MDKLFRLDGKVAVVTGGSRGLGYSMCEAFLLSGAARVYVSSRKKKACVDAAAALNEIARKHNIKGEAIPAAADCSSDAGVDELFQVISAREPQIDILAANAGATWGAPLGEHKGEYIDKVLDLNVKGVFLTIQAFAPLLAKAGKADDPSRVLVTGSVAGIRSGLSGGTYGYLASKAAVHHLTRSLAVELGPENITVNALAPGFFPTKMSNGLLSVIGDEMRETNPMRRLGEDRDIMGAVVYLCSRAGSYINGTVLPIDGGQNLSGKL